MTNLEQIAVIGAGTMGHGVGQVAAQSGLRVKLYDINGAVLENAMGRIEENLTEGIDKGKVTKQEREEALARLETTTDLASAVRAADLVVECAPEKMPLKKSLFASISERAPEHAVLATNTSSLSVTEIAAASSAPDRVVGMHFFNPVHIMKLVELVRAEQTSEATLQAAHSAGARLGREMILVIDSPGFATSRLGLVMGLEAARMPFMGIGCWSGSAELSRKARSSRKLEQCSVEASPRTRSPRNLNICAANGAVRSSDRTVWRGSYSSLLNCANGTIPRPDNGRQTSSRSRRKRQSVSASGCRNSRTRSEPASIARPRSRWGWSSTGRGAAATRAWPTS